VVHLLSLACWLHGSYMRVLAKTVKWHLITCVSHSLSEVIMLSPCPSSTTLLLSVNTFCF
jgi:hypothetical protein